MFKEEEREFLTEAASSSAEPSWEYRRPAGYQENDWREDAQTKGGSWSPSWTSKGWVDFRTDKGYYAWWLLSEPARSRQKAAPLKLDWFACFPSLHSANEIAKEIGARNLRKRERVECSELRTFPFFPDTGGRWFSAASPWTRPSVETDLRLRQKIGKVVTFWGKVRMWGTKKGAQLFPLNPLSVTDEVRFADAG